MNQSFSISKTLPEGPRHDVTLTVTGPSTAIIVDKLTVAGLPPSANNWPINNIRRTGDMITADLPRMFGFFVPKVSIVLRNADVQLRAPGHNMDYPISTAEHGEAEAVLNSYPDTAAKT